MQHQVILCQRTFYDATFLMQGVQGKRTESIFSQTGPQAANVGLFGMRMVFLTLLEKTG